jgi:hypothetical protein
MPEDFLVDDFFVSADFLVSAADSVFLVVAIG